MTQWATVSRELRVVIFWLKKLFRLPKPQLLVVGVVHQHQWLEGVNSTRLEREQREQFMGRMRRLIQGFRPTLVLDEIPDADNRALMEILPNRPIPIDIPAVQKLEGHSTLKGRCIFCVRTSTP
jgi:hypothetical protein